MDAIMSSTPLHRFHSMSMILRFANDNTLSSPTQSLPIYSLPWILQAELIDPAVKGTLNVRKSCKRSLVNRVVLTSSIAAIIAREPFLNGINDVVDETTFSDPKFVKRKR